VCMAIWGGHHYLRMEVEAEVVGVGVAIGH
jgi:hypothetical protein